MIIEGTGRPSFWLKWVAAILVISTWTCATAAVAMLVVGKMNVPASLSARPSPPAIPRQLPAPYRLGAPASAPAKPQHFVQVMEPGSNMFLTAIAESLRLPDTVHVRKGLHNATGYKDNSATLPNVQEWRPTAQT